MLTVLPNFLRSAVFLTAAALSFNALADDQAAAHSEAAVEAVEAVEEATSEIVPVEEAMIGEATEATDAVETAVEGAMDKAEEETAAVAE